MSRARSRSRVLAAGLALFAGASPGADALPAPMPGMHAAGCLPGERGYLQASLRGALQAQLDWRGAVLECQGGARPEGGIRISLSGPLDHTGTRLRLIIGMAVPAGRTATGPVSANVTAILEGQNRIYASRGDGHCEVEALRQEALPAAAGTGASVREFRVAARGFCIDPLPALTSGSNADGATLYIDRFDFAAMASFTPESIDASLAAH